MAAELARNELELQRAYLSVLPSVARVYWILFKYAHTHKYIFFKILKIKSVIASIKRPKDES